MSGATAKAPRDTLAERLRLLPTGYMSNADCDAIMRGEVVGRREPVRPDIDHLTTRPPTRRRHTHDAAALKRAIIDNPGDIEDAARQSGCISIHSFRCLCQINKVAIPGWPTAEAAMRADTDTCDGEDWTADERNRLAALWMQKPMLSRAEIGRLMGRSHQAIQTAASRTSLPQREGMSLDNLAKARSTSKQRPCITCETMFFSEGPHHRMCLACRRGREEARVTDHGRGVEA